MSSVVGGEVAPQHPSTVVQQGLLSSSLNTNASPNSAATTSDGLSHAWSIDTVVAFLHARNLGSCARKDFGSEIYHMEQYDPHWLASMCLEGLSKISYIEPRCPTCRDSVFFLKITIPPSCFGGHQVFEAGNLKVVARQIYCTIRLGSDNRRTRLF